MAFNGSGLFSKLYSWVVEQASPPIEISKLDAQETDFATGLSNCILRDGTGVPTAATPWNSQNLTGVGTLTAITGTISGNATVGGTLGVTGVITGVGSGLTTLNASNLSSGTVPSARVAGAYTAVTAIGNTGSHVSFGSSGNVTIAAPSSGASLTLSAGGSYATPQLNMLSNQYGMGVDASGNVFFKNTNNGRYTFYDTAGASRVDIAAGGNVTIAAPSSGVTLMVAGLAGAHSATIADIAGTGGLNVGYLNLYERTFAGADNTAAADNGKCVRYTSSGHTFTLDTDIPTNGVVTIRNSGSGNLTIAASGTLSWYNGSGAVGTGSRVLAVAGIVTATHMGSGNYDIWGTGLT
jgi:hypothetical protein